MSTFSDLPGEIVLIMLKTPTILDTTLAIAATCRGIRHVWNENRDTIIRCVLQKQIYCYGDAMKLAEAQLGPNAMAQEPLSFARQIVANHEEAELVEKDIESYGMGLKDMCINSQCCRSRQPEMSYSEKQRFFHAWYMIRQYTVVFENNKDRERVLQNEARQLCLEEARLLAMVMNWIDEYMAYEVRLKLGIANLDISDNDWALLESDPMKASWHYANELYFRDFLNRFEDDPKYMAIQEWELEACTCNPVFEPCDLGADKANDAAIDHVPQG